MPGGGHRLRGLSGDGRRLKQHHSTSCCPAVARLPNDVCVSGSAGATVVQLQLRPLLLAAHQSDSLPAKNSARTPTSPGCRAAGASAATCTRQAGRSADAHTWTCPSAVTTLQQWCALCDAVQVHVCTHLCQQLHGLGPAFVVNVVCERTLQQADLAVRQSRGSRLLLHTVHCEEVQRYNQSACSSPGPAH